MILVVFSAVDQVGAIASLAVADPAPVVVVTSMAMNVQLVLIGAAVGRTTRLSWRWRVATAWFLTEGASAGAAADGRVRPAAVLGARVAMYLAWNAGTAVGAPDGGVLPDPHAPSLDLVAPLTLLALAVPLLRSRPAAVAGVVAWLIGRVWACLAAGMGL